MYKKLIFILCLLFIVLLIGCKKEETNNDIVKNGVGYGITHEENVGIATMKVVNGEVDTVTFDEVYLLNIWARVAKLTGEVPTDVIVAGNYWYGKYIVIGDKHFTGTARTAVLTIDGVDYPTQTVQYSTDTIDDLYLWLRESEENCKWYATEVLAGNAYVAKTDWTKTTYESAGKGGWTKSTTNYWPSNEGVLGWSGNMTEIAKALKGTKMDATNNIEQTEDGWAINDVVSGATATSFPDYYAIAVRAYQNAK